MGYTSQSGTLIMGTQPTPGTFRGDLATTGTGMRHRTGTLAPTRTVLITDAEIGSGRDVTNAYLGSIKFAGDYQTYMRGQSIALFLKATLGLVSSVTTGTGTALTGTHTITPTDSGQLPFVSIYERISNGLDRYQYTDCVANMLHLECGADAYAMANCSFIAKSQLAGVADIDPTAIMDNGALTVGTNVTVSYGGVSVQAKNIILDINNNVDDTDFTLGSFYVADLTAKRRDIKGSFKLRDLDATFMHQATYGTTTANAAGGLTTKLPLVITFTSYEVIGTSVVPYSVQLTMPKVMFEPFSFAPNLDSILESDIKFQVLRPDNAQVAITAVVVNDKATVN
jgi:hypothetical protein